MRKKLIACLLAAGLLLLCGCDVGAKAAAESAPPARSVAAQEGEFHNAHSLTQLRMVGKGDEAAGYKLAFREPENFDGVEGYLVMYSVRPIGEVWEYLKGMTREELAGLDKPANRAYVIADLSYCDGVGNTLNSAQKDVVTGLDFSEAGTHFFYAAAFGASGVLSLEQAGQTVDIAAYAGQLRLCADEDTVSGSFAGSEDGVIDKNYLFFSAEGFAGVKDRLKNCDRQTLDDMAGKGWAHSFANAEYTEFSLEKAALRDMEGRPLSQNDFYYAYVASASAGEMIGVSYCGDSFVTPDILPESSGSIGTGHGILFPNGGAAAIGGGRSSIISTSQEAFRTFPDTPKVAVIGASSGSEREIWAYFYQDDASVKSYKDRFADAGFEAVYIPLTAENARSVGNDEYFAALVSSCHGVYFTGGDQSLGICALLQEDGGYNAVGRAVQELFGRGGFLAGTSAGAHMLGSVCYQDADPLKVLTHTRPQQAQPARAGVSCGPEGAIYEGLPCDKEAAGASLAFDSHFGARGRLARLCVMQRSGGAAYAIGLDEATGIAVTDGVGTVYGAGTVTILDGKAAEYGGDAARFSVSNLRVHILSTGDRFDFAAGRVMPTGTRAEIEEKPTAERPECLLEGSSAQTRALLTFAASGEAEISHEVAADGVRFEIVLGRGEEFFVLADEKTFAAPALSDLRRMAVGDMVLSIRPGDGQG